MEIHDLLQELGFGDYEARAYVALLSAGASNGYEVAKAAGMPRANVYPVLEKLVERGVAQRLDTPNGVRYAAIPSAHLIEGFETRHRRILKALETGFASLAQQREAAPVFNLQGRDELMARAQADIDAAQETLLVAIQPPEATALARPLKEAQERGVAITTLCMESCAEECGGCQGDIHRYRLAPGGDTRWFMLVVDTGRMLAGEISATHARAIATEQHLVVELTASYIRQSIALAIVAGDLGERFHGLLSEEARRILDALHPEDGFFERLEQVADGKAA